jgi:hypothetical protein
VLKNFVVVFCSMVLLCAGCGRGVSRMEYPEDPHGRFRAQIAAARQVLDKKEDWAGRAEWEVLKSRDGWQVIAWRVEYPERTGPKRYLPWGYSVIDLDSRLVPTHYHRKG